jgi:two-component system alkaline phosphatase synthesis response regulator PhoP
MSERKLLIVDDEKDILELLKYNFELDGMEVMTAEKGRDAIDIAIQTIPNIILLDVMLPDIDGIEVCETLRRNGALNNTIIIFLSARGEDYSQVAGYRAGADDYIVKPIRVKVLRHKVKALLERNKDYYEGVGLSNIKIDSERFSIIKDGKESIIPKKEFELLSYLMSAPDKVFRREEILTEVWGDAFIGDRTIDVHVRKLREKFGREIIRTVKGVGYRFTG